MSERIWYIDPVDGNDENDGSSAATPLKGWSHLRPLPGESVLFKRGSTIRGVLEPCDGDENASVIYGAYGEGSRPAFLGSTAVGDPGLWCEILPSIWRCSTEFSSEVCNVIFENGASCGNLRWGINELGDTGEWYYSGIGANSSSAAVDPDYAEHRLYLCSTDNPGDRWSSIECALWGERRLVGGKHHVIIEGLSFENSGVHGYQEVHPVDVTIRDCAFRNIGGAVWSLEHRVRFGNAVELWDGAQDVTVEGCMFDNIYDAGVTHQGGGTSNIPERVFFRDNLFIGCGLSAYECREPSREIYFEYNTCVNSGGGFALQGEAPPRRSEIFTVRDENFEPVLVRLADLPTHVGETPEPIAVGHHVFIWRIDPGTQPGQVYVRNNVFCEAPNGAAVYSIIQSQDMRKFVLDKNRYMQTTGNLLAMISGRSYLSGEFERMRTDWHAESGGSIDDVVFVDEANDDYRLRTEGDSPVAGTRKKRCRYEPKLAGTGE